MAPIRTLLLTVAAAIAVSIAGCARTSPLFCGGNEDPPCEEGQSCIAGRCVPTAVAGCLPGKVLCGDECVSLASDALNCGACARTCPANQLCSGGTCTSSCPQGLATCDRSCVDLMLDHEHCGACSNACSSGAS